MKKALYAKQLSVSLPKATIARIKSVTNKEEISISEWIREAIDYKFSIMDKENAK